MIRKVQEIIRIWMLAKEAIKIRKHSVLIKYEIKD